MSYDDHPAFRIDARAASAYTADLQAIWDQLPTRPRVLEVGCGTGLFTKYLVDRGCNVVGVDKSADNLAVAKQRCGATFVITDCASDEFSERALATGGPFDLLISRYVIHELADPIDTFARWKPLLSKTRLLTVIENSWSRTDWGWSEWGRRTDDLPLACTQTWATASYCLQKAGYDIASRKWMDAVNALHSTRLVNTYRLYVVTARLSE